MKKAALLATAVIATALPLIATAQFARPDDAIKYRQSALFLIGQNFGRIAAMANDKAPFDAESAKRSARVVAQLASVPWEGFAAGTDKGTTKALPEIWTDPDKFAAAAKRFQEQAPKLLAAAETGDKGQIKAAVG